jgi:hypothetical protein
MRGLEEVLAALDQLRAFPPLGRVVLRVYRLQAADQTHWFTHAVGQQLTPADRTLMSRVLAAWGRPISPRLVHLEEAGAECVATLDLSSPMTDRAEAECEVGSSGCACPDCDCEEVTSLGVCPACRAGLHAEMR